VQKQGTARVGAFFGPVMLVWFTTLAVLGVVNVVDHPRVLLALNPYYAVEFFRLDGWIAFLALGSVVLVVTGSEALYADMGHFGRFPIRLAWFILVLPALMLNYFGQGALIIGQPDAVDNPLFRMVPEHLRIGMVGLATIATIIASQAVITGAFSVTRQAIQLGYLPRMQIIHTSAMAIGQIYVPFVNWMLAIIVACLVVGFKSSTHLAAAYGIAVTGTMIIDGLLLVSEVNGRLGLDLGEVEAKTLGGYITAELGRIARVGDRVPIHGGRELRVVEMKGRRVSKVLLTATEGPRAAASSAIPAQGEGGLP